MLLSEDKVIEGMEHCRLTNLGLRNCDGCPYASLKTDHCPILDDSLELVYTQQIKLLTYKLKEINNNG